MFWIAVLFEGGLGILAILLAWWCGIPLVSRMAVGWEQVLWGLAAAGPMVIAFWILLHLRYRPLKRIVRYVRWLVRTLFPTGSLVEMALISILAGLGEEMLFRGVLQPLVGRWTFPWFGILAASLLFGLAHCVSRLYFFLAAVIGLYFGILAHLADSVFIPAMTHACYDCVVLYYLAYTIKKRSGSMD
ncbi:MAG: CPBP family intramembrane metalloprotease [Pirellulales bacterium]|nr:CPBP family intramembrane metalloprotease [Pirellulales bacterium]